ncbi:hypothetical protein ACFW9U_28310 [Rhodococcus aetherivorans]|uniref:hypothetical protein n=1 Tax=Rhodococcus aetherivorans TaxID=191292 RepID=UPI00366E6AB1
MPLPPASIAFSGHYGFEIDVLSVYCPTGKGRIERQVTIVRDHVLAGRTFTDLADVDQTLTEWVPIRRGQVHRPPHAGSTLASSSGTAPSSITPRCGRCRRSCIR